MTRLFRGAIRIVIGLTLVFLATLVASGAHLNAPRAALAAPTFTVNSTLDTPDATIDTICDDGAGNCTLRAAIMEANAGAPGALINFAISGGTFQVITPTSSLPVISTPMTIDGTTQSGSGVVGIEVTGASCTSGCSDGFQVTAGSSTLKGFNVTDWPGNGIAVLGPEGGNTLSTNRIGWEVSGSTGIAAGNGGAGILIDGSGSNSITTGKINGNGVGIVIRASGGSGATGNSIGNVGIGENQNNTGAIPNAGAGVEIDGSGVQPVTGNHVGGATGTNTIVGNSAEGVLVHGAMASGNFVQADVIGEACPTGNCLAVTTPIPNGSHGVFFRDGAHDNTVGPASPSDPPTYIVFSAHNHGAGVALDAGYAADDRNLVRILSYANDHLGIDVADTTCSPQPSCRFGTVTPLFPDSAFTSSLYCPGCGTGGMLVQTGYLHGYTPGQTVVSDIAINDTCDPSGFGQAQHAFAGSSFYSAPNSFVADTNGDLSVAAAVVGPTTDFGFGPSGVALVGKSAVAVLYLPDRTTGEYGNCVTVKNDADGDGIEDSIDPLPGSPSNVFDSRPLGGTAYGSIVARNGCYVSVVPLPLITDGGTIGVVCPPPATPGGQAQVSVCGIGTLTISDGQSVTGNCASLDTKVAYGPVTVTFGSFGATLPTNSMSKIEDCALASPPCASGGQYRVTNTGTVAIVADGNTVAPGSNITLLSACQTPGDCDHDPAYPTVWGDGCADVKEPLLVPPTDSTSPWDFLSVPVPALYAAPNPLVVFHDSVVGAADAQAVFAYFKAGAHSGTSVYEQDLNTNGIKDGIEYDRSVVGSGRSGPPDGVVAASDAQLAFAQFKLGYHC